MSQKPIISLTHIVISFTDYQDLIKENPIVLLEFKSKTCHASNMLQSHCKIFSEKYVNFKFASIDVDNIGEQNMKKFDGNLKLAAIPSFFLFMNGAIIDKIITPTNESLEDFIRNYYDGEPVKSSNSNYEQGYSKEIEWNRVKSVDKTLSKSKGNNSNLLNPSFAAFSNNKGINDKKNFLSPSNAFPKSKSSEHLNSSLNLRPKSTSARNSRDATPSREFSGSNLKKSSTAEKITQSKKK